MLKFDPQYLEFFQSRQLHLIRLNGKIPIDSGWSNSPTAPQDIRAHAKAGKNVGWCVGENHLIIDVDPRNGGGKSFQELCAAIKISSDDLIANYPTIRTGSGGLHIYMSKDVSLAPSKKSDRFPGIDLIHGKNQILIPGCVHPKTKKHYLPDMFSVWGGEPPLVPESFKAFLAADWGSLGSSGEQGASKAHLAGVMSVEVARKVLGVLHARDHADDWVEFILGLWHATGGDRDLVPDLILWSQKDPNYTDDPTVEKRVEQIWDSARDDFDNPRTVQTFIALLKKDNSEKAANIARLLEGEVTRAQFDDVRIKGDEIGARIKGLVPEDMKNDPAKVLGLVGEALELDDPVQLARLKKSLVKAVNLPMSEVNPLFASVRKQKKGKDDESKKSANDWIVELAGDVLRKYFEKGEHLRRAPNQIYYQYHAGVWRATNSEHIRACTMPHVRDTATTFKKQPYNIITMTESVESYIRTEVHTLDTRLAASDKLASAVNCLNGTLWIDETTGKAEFKEHTPSDFLTHQVPLMYTPQVKCPSFDTMLKQVFAPLGEKYGVEELQDFIRHWWEVLGYMVQPHKNIPLVNLWYGGGLNGKTTIANIICSLVGSESVFSTQIGKFVDNSNSHLSAGLVGKLILMDDDVRAGTVLAEDVLKAYSETKALTVNPKFQAPYETKVHVTPLLLANNRVLMLDRSHGMWRRLNVVPFLANLEPLKKSKLPHQVVDRELPGVLNAAIAGLQRLRARGDFDWPQASLDARKQFFEQSNPICLYVRRNWEESPEGSVSMYTLYASYQYTCKVEGVKRVETFTRFSDVVEQMGFEVSGVTVKGLSIRPGFVCIDGGV